MSYGSSYSSSSRDDDHSVRRGRYYPLWLLALCGSLLTVGLTWTILGSLPTQDAEQNTSTLAEVEANAGSIADNLDAAASETAAFQPAPPPSVVVNSFGSRSPMNAPLDASSAENSGTAAAGEEPPLHTPVADESALRSTATHISPSTLGPPEAARCRLRFSDASAMKGPCVFRAYSGDEFEVSGFGENFSVQVRRIGNEHHALSIDNDGLEVDLGQVSHSGACWESPAAEVCAWNLRKKLPDKSPSQTTN